MKHEKSHLVDEPLYRVSLFQDCDALLRDAETEADFADEWSDWPDDDLDAIRH